MSPESASELEEVFELPVERFGHESLRMQDAGGT
jgi:hypothetical protein